MERVKLKKPGKKSRGDMRGRIQEVARRGRPKGVKNKYPSVIKTAVTMAANLVGFDGHGKRGLVGYLQWAAINEPVAFLGLLGKCMPLQITGDASRPVRLLAPGVSPADAQAAYAETLKAIAATPVLQVTAPVMTQSPEAVQKKFEEPGIEMIEDAEYEDIT